MSKRKQKSRSRRPEQAKPNKDSNIYSYAQLGEDLKSHLPPIAFKQLPTSSVAKLKKDVRELSTELSAEERPGLMELAWPALKKHVFVRAESRCRPNIELDQFPPGEHQMDQFNVFYWKELDELAHHSRAAAFELFRVSMASAIENWRDPSMSGVFLRRAIETVFWAAFYQYGVSSAYRVLRSAVEDFPPGYVISQDIEDFIRGSWAVSPGRVEAGWRAVCGSGENAHFDEKWVDATTATQAKQGSILRCVAEERGGDMGARVLRTLATLESAYYYLCGFTHVTPLSLQQVLPIVGEPPSDLPSYSRLLVEVLVNSCFLFEEYVLAPDRSGETFLMLLMPNTPTTRGNSALEPMRVCEFNFPFLQDLRKGDRGVVIKLEDGEHVTLYKRGKQGPKCRDRENRKSPA